jgi:hypothetical protein
MAKASSGTAVTKVTKQLPVNIAELLKKEAEELGKRIQAPGGDKIKLTKDKQFKLPDGTKHPGPLTVVILDFVSTNQFFDKPFKEGEAAAPACFAIGLEPNSMAPSDNSPKKQSDTCGKCPNNEFGSKGDGKACRNMRKLAVIAGAGDTAGDVNSSMWVLEVSPTAIKAFDAYVSSVKTQFGVPPIGVVTDIFMDPSSDFQSLRFGNPQLNPNLETHFSRRAAARERLLAEPDVSRYTESTAKKKK